jgi:hypothetical protein
VKALFALSLAIGLAGTGCNRDRNMEDPQMGRETSEPVTSPGATGEAQDQEVEKPSDVPATPPSESPDSDLGTETGEPTTGTGDIGSGEEVGTTQHCQRLSSCYRELSSGLCAGDATCSQVFSLNPAPTDEAQCRSMLQGARQKAQPYMQAKPDYQFPASCEVETNL